MNKTEQGVLQQSTLSSWLVHIVLLLTSFVAHAVYAESTSASTTLHKKDTPKHHVFILSSAENIHHSSIMQIISDDLILKRSDIIISKIDPDEKIKKTNRKTDLIISIGLKNTRNADLLYPDIKKLFISTDPNKYRPDTKKNKNDAILYMTQPFCRQIGFIRHLDKDWKTISILNSQNKPVDAKKIRQCANSLDIKIYIVSTTVKENLTNKIKHALNHSDILLAHPDSTIYNRKNIKNILLTSYRYRKPVIGFSENFVNAGALASVNSNTDQIAKSATRLIEQYFDAGNKFSDQVNYPVDFDININRQVSRALNITVPDIDKLKRETMQAEKKGKSL